MTDDLGIFYEARGIIEKAQEAMREAVAHLDFADAALSAMQGDGWRGIESAPKSTQVNVYHPESGVVGAYLRSEGDSDDGWWWSGEGPGDYHASAILPAPTAWQPLPAPPKETPT